MKRQKSSRRNRRSRSVSEGHHDDLGYVARLEDKFDVLINLLSANKENRCSESAQPTSDQANVQVIEAGPVLTEEFPVVESQEGMFLGTIWT